MNMLDIKKPLVIISALAVLIVLIATAAVFVRIKNLDRQIAQSKDMLQKMRQENAALEEQKSNIVKEKEKLQADTMSYINLNTKLQEEKDKLKQSVDDAQKVIENKESNLQRATKRLEEIEKSLADTKLREDNALIKEKKTLIKKMVSLNSTLKKERALYHYNLGVAYASAKLYDDAADEYKKSLDIDDSNADAHYNLALIYDTVQIRPEDALKHYRAYLELRPRAEDRDEVESLIKKLQNG